ncbi:MAG: restriction endonuclease subunit S [Aerococcus sanguinicola]
MIDTELLKEKVLDLAMHGKLVEQDPTEGSAKELLEEVKLERERLIEDKKIKKSKPLPEITEEEIPYEIPESWKWVRADELLLVTMGQSPKKETINSSKRGYEFHQGKSLFTNKYLGISDTYTEAENKVICSPAVIMSVRAPVGDVNLVDRDIFIGRGLAAFQTLGSVDIEYIYYYLSTIKKDLERVSTGSTFKAINSTVVRNICIPVPPAKEQERIITKLDEINQVMHDKS